MSKEQAPSQPSDTPQRTKIDSKIGSGHAAAMLRQGLKELQSAVYADSNVAREPEPGTFGSPTQGEIAADRRADREPSVLDKHTPEARAGNSPSRERGVHDGPSPGMTGPERE